MVYRTTWPIQPPGQIPRANGPSRPTAGSTASPSFRDVLKQAGAAREVKFSAHAAERLRTRQIAVTPEQQRQLTSALDTAAAKGARESLVLMDGLAMVVSVPNRTVITVVRQAELADRVFTGIDSAVVLAGKTNGK